MIATKQDTRTTESYELQWKSPLINWRLYSPYRYLEPAIKAKAKRNTPKDRQYWPNIKWRIVRVFTTTTIRVVVLEDR